MQNIVVRKGEKKGRYFVVAGGRRLAALKLLAEAGEIAKDHPIECKEREGEIATAISLAENVMREEMHPVDQYEAFDALAKQGKDIADIAARFGTTEIIVRKRLALARVSPILLQHHRDDDMSFAQLSGFTVSDDHERQVTVWNSLPSWNRDPHSIRRALTEEMISATDKRVQFIGGLAAYEEVGGSVNRSRAFHDVAWKNLKDAGFPDRILWHKAAAAKFPWCDISNVGIFGTSAGGQNAVGALLFHPDFYKVAVANSGCYDNRMDKIWWNEQWMGWPVGIEYQQSSDVDNAYRLQGRLMLVVGEMDHNVDPSSTFQLADRLIKAGKDFEMVYVPGADHGAPGAFSQRKLLDFFVRNILGQTPPNWNATPLELPKESWR
ncbi:hypothetical protein EHS39_36685 [Ensifer sp. MPMI2T]|nr:hypothetical protein EHS39_36685 [Ensifer sp. MPMI2T]